MRGQRALARRVSVARSSEWAAAGSVINPVFRSEYLNLLAMAGEAAGRRWAGEMGAAQGRMAGQMIGLLISIVLPANFIGVLIIGNWRGVDPVSDPVIGRLFAAFVVVYFPVLLFGAASSGVIADQRVWRRSVGVFGFWCWVIGLCCPPTMGADSLGKGLLVGRGSGGRVGAFRVELSVGADR